MTVQNRTPWESKIGNGVATSFSFSFSAFEISWIYIQSQDGDLPLYEVNLNAEGDGGTVVFAEAPGSLHQFVIYRRTPLVQDTDYPRFGRFPAESHETALDKLTLILQEASVNVSRSLRVPYYEEELDELPSAAERAGRLLGFDEQGLPIMASPEDVGIDSESIAHRPSSPNEPTYVGPELRKHQADLIVLDDRATSTENALENKANEAIRIISSDPQLIEIESPTLASDVTLGLKVDVPNGIPKLDAGGQIKSSQIPIMGFSYQSSFYPSETEEGADNPSDRYPEADWGGGDTFVLSGDGFVDLGDGTALPVTSGSALIWVSANESKVIDEDVWQYVPRTIPTGISASDVIANPHGNLTGTNVQSQLEGLEAEKIGTVGDAILDGSLSLTGNINLGNDRYVVCVDTTGNRYRMVGVSSTNSGYYCHPYESEGNSPSLDQIRFGGVDGAAAWARATAGQFQVSIPILAEEGINFEGDLSIQAGDLVLDEGYGIQCGDIELISYDGQEVTHNEGHTGPVNYTGASHFIDGNTRVAGTAVATGDVVGFEEEGE